MREERAKRGAARRHTLFWAIAGAAALVALGAMGLRDRVSANRPTAPDSLDAMLTQLELDPRLRLNKTRSLVESVAGQESLRASGLAEAWYAYGLRLFYRDEDLEGAERAFAEASRLKPEWAWPHNTLGIVRFTMGKHEEALASFERALELAPGWSRPHSDLAILYRRAGNLDAARHHIELALELEPNDPMNWFNRAVVLDTEGNHDAARQMYEAVLREIPGLPHAIYNLSCSYAREGDAETAVPLLAEAIEKIPVFRLEARDDPDFDPIRDDAAFFDLVGSDAEDHAP